MSNALEQASLIMVPSGYEDGTLGSLKPTDGTGDFTFTRGSNISATRVNADGNIEKGYENLLTYSNDFLNADWIKASITPTGGQLGYDGSNDAWRIEVNASAASARLQQNISQNICTYSVYAKEGNTSSLGLKSDSSVPSWFDLSGSGSVTLGTGCVDASITSVGDGWFRCSVTFPVVTSVRFYVSDSVGSFPVSAGAYLYIQDAMLNQGMVAYPYVETTTAPVAGGILEDMPRLDYSNGSCPSLLLEPSRTNLIRYSEYFNTSPWINRDVTTIENATTSPEGVQNATRINFSGTDLKRIEQNTPNDATSCTASIYMKYIDHPYVMARLDSTSGAKYTMYNIQTGSIESNTMDDAKIIPVGDGWYRLIATQDIQAAQEIFWYFTETSSISQSAWTGSGSLYAYGAQFEQGYPTSYIPTYGVSQTRLADNYTGAALSLDGVLGNTQGTIFYEFSNSLATSGDVFVNYFSSPNGGFARFRNYFQTSGLTGVTSSNPFMGNIRGKTKIAVSYGGGDMKMFTDGVENDSSTYTGDISLNSLYNPILNQTNESLASNNSGIKKILFFPTALSDEECIALTS